MTLSILVDAGGCLSAHPLAISSSWEIGGGRNGYVVQIGGWAPAVDPDPPTVETMAPAPSPRAIANPSPRRGRYPRFAARLRVLLLHQDRAQTDLAIALSVTSAAVSSWATGRAFPGEDMLARLASVLGVTPEDLAAGDAQRARGHRPAQIQPTPVDLSVLATLRELSERGLAPNLRELAQATGMRSRGTLSARLQRLAAQGLVVKGDEKGLRSSWRLAS